MKEGSSAGDRTFRGFVFQDSDLYKWVEAAGYSLMWHPDEELEKLIGEAVSLIVSAQQEDGYLDTYYIINGLDKRFTNIKENHELYCMGHLIEAAVAHYEATGCSSLVQAAQRFADCAMSVIGHGEGKRHAYPGHDTCRACSC